MRVGFQLGNVALIWLCCGGIGLALGCFYLPLARRCTIAYRCAETENIAWASDGSACFVFRNACHLANENCRRKNQNRRALSTVSQANCQQMCVNSCPALFQPVCATYDGFNRSFTNNCTLQSFICNTGLPYMLLYTGECDDAPIVPFDPVAD